MTDRPNTRASMPSRLLRAAGPAVLAAAGWAADPAPALAADGDRPAVRAEGDAPRPREGGAPRARDAERPKEGDRPREAEAAKGRRGGPPILVKVEGDTLILRTSNGDNKDVPFTLPEGATVTINDHPASLADLKPGMMIRSHFGPDARMVVDAYNATARTGGEADRPREGEPRKAEVPHDGEPRRVDVPRDGDRPRDGDPRKADAPRDGERRPEGEATRRDPTPRGGFVRLAGSDIVLKVGDNREAALAVGDNPTVLINEAPAQLSDLKPGMMVVVVKQRNGTVLIEAKTPAREREPRPEEGQPRKTEGR